VTALAQLDVTHFIADIPGGNALPPVERVPQAVGHSPIKVKFIALPGLRYQLMTMRTVTAITQLELAPLALVSKFAAARRWTPASPSKALLVDERL
jgi:hypothetical protein